MLKRALTFIIVCIMMAACANQITSAPTNTPTSRSSLVSSFPQSITTPSAFYDAVINGELVLSNGCLRVNDTDGNSFLLIWRPGFSIRTDQGVVQIIDSTGQVTASVGDFVEVGGGGDLNPTWYGLVEPLPENCPGPYFIVGESIKKIDRP